MHWTTKIILCSIRFTTYINTGPTRSDVPSSRCGAVLSTHNIVNGPWPTNLDKCLISTTCVKMCEIRKSRCGTHLNVQMISHTDSLPRINVHWRMICNIAMWHCQHNYTGYFIFENKNGWYGIGPEENKNKKWKKFNFYFFSGTAGPLT